jgi:hypothetical protein
MRRQLLILLSVCLLACETRQVTPTETKVVGQEAAIVGRVTNQAGNPIAKSAVWACRNSWTEHCLGDVATTDENGEFRVAGLYPGTYTIAASPPEQEDDRGKPPTAYIMTFLGGVATPDQSRRVGLKAGENGTADIALLRAPLFSIRGKVVDEHGKTIPLVAPQLRYIGVHRFFEHPDVTDVQNDYFVLHNLRPGDYSLYMAPDEWDPYSGSVRVTIGSADVDNVVLKTTRAVRFQGKVRAEDPDFEFAAEPEHPAEYAVYPYLDPTYFVRDQWGLPFVALADAFDDSPRPFDRIQPKGAFSIVGTNKPQYLMLGALPQGYHVKQVRQGGRDVMHSKVRPGVPIDVLISRHPAAAGIRGKLRGGYEAVIWPAQPDRSDFAAGVRGIRDVPGPARLRFPQQARARRSHGDPGRRGD